MLPIDRSNITAYDIGLRELEILYNPDVFDNETKGNGEITIAPFSKEVAFGALLIMLNSPLQELNAKNILSCDNITNTEINNLITQVDFESAIYEKEIAFVVENQIKYEVDEKQVVEEEIIDAYLKEVGRFYPKNKKIVL